MHYLLDGTEMLQRMKQHDFEAWQEFVIHVATEDDVIASVAQQIARGVDDSGSCGGTSPTVFDDYPRPLSAARRWLIERADDAARRELEGTAMALNMCESRLQVSQEKASTLEAVIAEMKEFLRLLKLAVKENDMERVRVLMGSRPCYSDDKSLPF
jgi:hypothetical protein